VTGVDLNPGMIAVARSLPAPSGARVEWVVCSALDTRLPGTSFDVVLCQQGFQFFPDRQVALREIRRVLVPGGRIAVSVWRNTGIYNTAVGDALRALFGAAIASVPRQAVTNFSPQCGRPDSTKRSCTCSA
jgi:ubiquinone/menaquinone biosynthesis C-methylase UbiE